MSIISEFPDHDVKNTRYVHYIPMKNSEQPVGVVSWVSEGLAKHFHQPDFVITVRLIDREQATIDQHDVLAEIVQLVANKNKKHILFGPGSLLSLAECKDKGLDSKAAVLFVSHPHFKEWFCDSDLDIEWKGEPMLACLLLSQAEAEIVQACGSQRYLSMLGNLTNHFPHPLWSEWLPLDSHIELFNSKTCQAGLMSSKAKFISIPEGRVI